MAAKALQLGCLQARFLCAKCELENGSATHQPTIVTPHLDHGRWERRQLGDMDAKGGRAGAVLDFEQHGDAVGCRVGSDVAVDDALDDALQRRQLVKVRREHAEALGGASQVLRDCPCQAKAIKGRSAAPQLVNNDQGLVSCGLHRVAVGVV